MSVKPKPEKSDGLAATPPVSLWHKPLKLEAREFFTALTKLAIFGAVGERGDAGASLAEAGKAVGLETSADELLWTLIYTSLTAAVAELAQEHASHPQWNHHADTAELDRTLGEQLTTLRVTVDRDLFDHPTRLAGLDDFVALFAEWLHGHGLVEARSRTVASRLPSYFALALHREWVAIPDRYDPIAKSLDSPFASAARHEREWTTYGRWLQKQFDESVFGETFGQRDVYIPLRGYYEVRSDDKERGAAKRVVDLHQAIDAWLHDPKLERDTVRLIRGGPGSGKSTFTKMLAAHLADPDQETLPCRVLYLPLHQLNLKDDLYRAVGDYLREVPHFTLSPLEESRDRPLLLIFDGLDELEMQGLVGAAAAVGFVQQATTMVDRLNTQRPWLRVLLSGRDVAVQAVEGRFRQPGQVLHVLPYVVASSETSEYDDPDTLLEEDQRDRWWRAYARLTGESLDGLPEAFEDEAYQELTSQPLLNYLLALSRENGRIDFARPVNLNDVYFDLLQSVHERGWEHRQHRTIQYLEFDDFVNMLEEVGLAAWHGDGRTASIGQIRAYCERSRLGSVLEKLQQGAEDGVTRLLTAFYFRRQGASSDGDATFEFTHKSFGEYLAARALVKAVDAMCAELQATGRPSAWDERECLRHWAEWWCGPTAMDSDLLAFLRREVKLRHRTSPELVQAWQLALARLIAWMLRHGMPMEGIRSRPSYAEECRQAANAEEGLLALLNCCVRSADRPVAVNWPDRFALGR